LDIFSFLITNITHQKPLLGKRSHVQPNERGLVVGMACSPEVEEVGETVVLVIVERKLRNTQVVIQVDSIVFWV
jgi:hypothetical protein